MPDRFDLRRRGWRLRGGDDPLAVRCPVLAMGAADWLDLANGERGVRARTVLLGTDKSTERTRLLRLGFGDVVGEAIGLAELDERLRRVAGQKAALTVTLQRGQLLLDLVARDGFLMGRRLGLHPREFALLWRLGRPRRARYRLIACSPKCGGCDSARRPIAWRSTSAACGPNCGWRGSTG